MNKVLSISIAAYNAANFLNVALESVVTSKLADSIQIIIVDDGSKDETRTLANKWAKEYPEIITVISKENGGYGSTINSAIEVASGKYYKLLDADDCYDTEELTRLVEFLKKAEEDLIITDYYRCQDSLDNRAFFKTLNLDYDIEQSINALPNIDIMHALVVRTNILQKWPNDYKISEHCFYTDLEFCVKTILSSKNFIYKDFKVYCYLIGREGQSVSLDGRVKHIDNHDHVVRLVSTELLKADEQLECRKRVFDMIKGHVLYYSLCVKPTIRNLNKFIGFRNFVIHETPYPQKEYKGIRRYLRHPRLFYLPRCLLNRIKNFLRKIIKGNE